MIGDQIAKSVACQVFCDVVGDYQFGGRKFASQTRARQVVFSIDVLDRHLVREKNVHNVRQA